MVTIIAESKVKESWGILLAKEVTKYIIPVTLLCFAVFLWNVEKKYLGTFFSLQRGKDFTTRLFTEANREESKAEAVLNNSKNHWKSIEGDVKKWVESNWDSWETERPYWLNDAWLARIPVKFIPTTGDARRRESMRSGSVDAEAEGELGGALRASIKRGSIGLGSNMDIARVVPTLEEAN
jgi:hypothetical protein